MFSAAAFFYYFYLRSPLLKLFVISNNFLEGGCKTCKTLNL